MQGKPEEMTAKEYLQQVRTKEAVIYRLRCDRENLKEILYFVGGTDDNAKVQTSRDHDRFGNVFAKIDEKDGLIAEKLEELIEFKAKVSDEISMLTNPIYIGILHKRYICFHNFRQIAVDMGYSYGYVIKMHGYALLEFEEKCLKEKVIK